MKNGLELSKWKHRINTRKTFLQPTSHRAAAVPLKGSRESPALYVKHYSKKYLSVMEKIKPAQTGMVSKPSQLHMDKFLAPISTLKPGTMLSYAPTSSRFHQHRVVHFFPTIHVQLHIQTQLKLLLSWKKYLWIYSDFFLTPAKILDLLPSLCYAVNIDFAYWFWYKQGMNLEWF